MAAAKCNLDNTMIAISALPNSNGVPIVYPNLAFSSRTALKTSQIADHPFQGAIHRT